MLSERVPEAEVERAFGRIAGDDAHREELEVCADLGIGHHAFRSWPTADQAKAIALRRYRRTVCPDCGTRSEDWQHPITLEPHAEPRYVAEGYRCHGCRAVAQEWADIERQTKPYERRGLKVFLRRVFGRR